MAITEDDDFSQELLGGEAQPPGDNWITHLDQTLDEAQDLWQLSLGPQLQAGLVGFLVSATRRDGTEVVLKLRAPGGLMQAEAQTLARMDGRNSVRLIDAHYGFGAQLLEYVQPGRQLTEFADQGVDVDAAVAGLLGEPWDADDDASIPSLAARVEKWIRNLEALKHPTPLPEGRIERTVEELKELAASQTDSVLLHGDLHVGNVLQANRQPWLAIDPKGLIGERAFDAGWWLRDPPRSMASSWTSQLNRRLDVLDSEVDVDRQRVLAWARCGVVVLAAARAAAAMHDDCMRFVECSGALDSIS